MNKLALPDVPLWLIFEGVAQPVVLPGSATTDSLLAEAARLHNLDPKQRLSFVLGAAPVPLGIDISKTPLAKSRNLHVHVKVLDWPVKYASANPTTSGAGGAQTAVSASRARRDPIPIAQTILKCDSDVDAGAAQAEYKRQLPPTPMVVQCPECGAQWQEKLRDVLTDMTCVDCSAKFYAQHPDTVPPSEPAKRRTRRDPAWMQTPPLSAEDSASNGSASGRYKKSRGGGGGGGKIGNSVAPW